MYMHSMGEDWDEPLARIDAALSSNLPDHDRARLLAASRTARKGEIMRQCRGLRPMRSWVVVLCVVVGGLIAPGQAPAASAQCPSSSAPMAVVTETARSPSQDFPSPEARLEEFGDVRYLTLIY